MKFISLILLIGYSSLAISGSSGYIYQGKTVFLFKDGVAVENKPIFDSNDSREPASISSGMVLYFTEDEVARCYYWAPQAGAKAEKNIQCLKKSDLK